MTNFLFLLRSDSKIRPPAVPRTRNPKPSPRRSSETQNPVLAGTPKPETRNPCQGLKSGPKAAAQTLRVTNCTHRDSVAVALVNDPSVSSHQPTENLLPSAVWGYILQFTLIRHRERPMPSLSLLSHLVKSKGGGGPTAPCLAGIKRCTFQSYQ